MLVRACELTQRYRRDATSYNIMEQTGQPAPTTTSDFVFEAAVREAAVKNEDANDDPQLQT